MLSLVESILFYRNSTNNINFVNIFWLNKSQKKVDQTQRVLDEPSFKGFKV